MIFFICRICVSPLLKLASGSSTNTDPHNLRDRKLLHAPAAGDTPVLSSSMMLIRQNLSKLCHPQDCHSDRHSTNWTGSDPEEDDLPGDSPGGWLRIPCWAISWIRLDWIPLEKRQIEKGGTHSLTHDKCWGPSSESRLHPADSVSRMSRSRSSERRWPAKHTSIVK